MASKNRQILVIDGSEVARTIISRILAREMKSSQVTICGSAEEGLRALETRRFDLITTALMLPDCDGLELTRRIREHPDHRYTPVVVVSGDANSRLLREGFNAGVTDYFDKSLGYQAFVDFVQAFTSRTAGLVGHVLYVEDSRTAAAVVIKIMERHGLKVTHTTTAEEALALLEAQSCGEEVEPVDTVITDFYLQGDLTGGDLLHAIRSHLHLSPQEMPVLVVTMADNAERQVEVFHAGASDFVTKPIIEEVLMARIRSLLLIRQQHRLLQQQAGEIERLTITDSLTGLYNIRFLLEHGDELLDDPDNYPIHALRIKIDGFPRLRAERGTLASQQGLAALGGLLRQVLSDSEMAVRCGEDEFTLFMARCHPPEAEGKAELLRQTVQQLQPGGLPITLSIGIASNLDDADLDLEGLLERAMRALATAMRQGPGRIAIHSAEGAELTLSADCPPSASA